MSSEATEHTENEELLPNWSKSPPCETELSDYHTDLTENSSTSLNHNKSNTKIDFEQKEIQFLKNASNELKENLTQNMATTLLEDKNAGDKYKLTGVDNDNQNSCFFQRFLSQSFKNYSKNNIYSLTSFDKEYSNSFGKFDSVYNIKLSNILEYEDLSKVLYHFQAIIDGYSKIKDSNSDLSLTINNLNLLKEEKHSLFKDNQEVCRSEEYLNLNQNKLNFNCRHYVYLIKSYGQLCFPKQKIIICNVPNQETTSSKRRCIFTKNRQIGKGTQKLRHNFQYFKQKCILRNHISSKLSLTNNLDSDCESDISDESENLTELTLTEKRTSSKLAEIRKRVQKALAEEYHELHRREKQHLSFLDQCQQICDKTFSFKDFEKIYSKESNQNSKITTNVNMTSNFQNGTYSDLLKDNETIDLCTIVEDGDTNNDVSFKYDDVNNFSPNINTVNETNLLPEPLAGDVWNFLEQNAIANLSISLESKATFFSEADISSEVDTSIYYEADTSIYYEADTSIDLEVNTSIDLEANASIDLEANASIDLEANASIDLDTYESFELEVRTSIELEAKASMDFDAYESFESEADTGIELKADTDIKLEADTDIKLKADTDIELDDTSIGLADKCIQLTDTRNELKADTNIDLLVEAAASFYLDADANLFSKIDSNISLDAVAKPLNEGKVVNNYNQTNSLRQTYRFVELLGELIDRAPRLTVPFCIALGFVAAVVGKK